MKRFLLKITGVISPFIVIFLLYIAYDPYKIIWDYEDYTKFPSINSAYTSYKLMTKDDTIPYNSL